MEVCLNSVLRQVRLVLEKDGESVVGVKHVTNSEDAGSSTSRPIHLPPCLSNTVHLTSVLLSILYRLRQEREMDRSETAIIYGEAHLASETASLFIICRTFSGHV